MDPNYLMEKTYILTTFGEPDKTHGKTINRESMEKVLKSDKFRKALENRFLYGCLSHQARIKIEMSREKSQLPYADLVANSGEACNTLINISIIDRGGSPGVVGKIGVLNNEKGREVASLFNSGSKLKVSMATRTVVRGDEWIIQDILGVDFTTSPAFDTDEVTYNFSAKDSSSLTYFSLSIEELEENEGEEDQYFSLTGLREYLREKQRPAYQILHTRIRSIVQYIGSAPENKLEEDMDILVSYLRTFLLDWINSALKTPDKPMNILIGLRLNKYLDDRKQARKLQRSLRRAQGTLRSTGTIQKTIQKDLNENFGKVLNSIFTSYIRSKVQPDKQAVIDNYVQSINQGVVR